MAHVLRAVEHAVGQAGQEVPGREVAGHGPDGEPCALWGQGHPHGQSSSQNKSNTESFITHI